MEQTTPRAIRCALEVGFVTTIAFAVDLCPLLERDTQFFPSSTLNIRCSRRDITLICALYQTTIHPRHLRP